MSLQVVMIVGQETDSATNLMEKLSEETLLECIHLDTLEEAKNLVDAVLPDLILLFADSLEANRENVNDFCKNLKERTLTEQTESKPVLIVQTQADDEEKRIQYMLDGADDTLSSQLSPEELRVRILVQLRRNINTLSNNITLLPGLELASKVLQRKINLKKLYPDATWSLIMIELDQFEIYNEVYGYFGGNQVLRTFAVMLSNLVAAPDLIGHSSETDTFIIISTPDRAERLSRLLCRQFDDVAPNFYSEKDKKRGYIVAMDEHKVSRRVPLISLSMGIINSETQNYDSYKAAFNAAIEMKAMAKLTPGNHWVSDKFKLTGAKVAKEEELVKRILVIESDAALAFLLKTTLEMQHYDVSAVGTYSEALEALDGACIHLVLMDAIINDEEKGWELCEKVKTSHPHTQVIFISTVHDRDRALSVGADLYLPKPFELVSLFTSIDRTLKG